jgi:thioredoxin-related protein
LIGKDNPISPIAMLKTNILFSLLVLCSSLALSQDKKLYDPQADAASDIQEAVKKAAAENKLVLIQAGGNWCRWCIEFARFCKADKKIDSTLSSGFIWYHLNWSKENKNKPIFETYGYPQRFGFPVFIILNAKGERIHTQSSEYLEDGKKSYNREKVLGFLEMWSPHAFEPLQYEK